MIIFLLSNLSQRSLIFATSKQKDKNMDTMEFEKLSENEMSHIKANDECRTIGKAARKASPGCNFPGDRHV